VIFIYEDLQWGGGGGTIAGINAGDGINFVIIPGSISLSLTKTSNVGDPGVWIFEVDTGNNLSMCCT